MKVKAGRQQSSRAVDGLRNYFYIGDERETFLKSLNTLYQARKMFLGDERETFLKSLNTLYQARKMFLQALIIGKDP